MMTSLETMVDQCEETSRILKSLAHPQRLQLLCFLSEGERTVSELEKLCHTSQSQLSQFLQRMRSEGLVRARRDGKFVFYSIEDPKVFKLIQALHKIFCP
jgi:ArsR family transcriptional regulator, virulence genes transcriptional regulator